MRHLHKKFLFEGFLKIILIALLLQPTSGDKIKKKCKTCRKIIENFKKGMDSTAQNHFGGGDTAWEESRLGSYARSETRLLEILENVCKGADKESSCHAMVEEYEEQIENFWFNKHKELSDLENYLCIEKIKVCCPDNKWGTDCKDCPGGPDNICNGRGKCAGAGTRSGNGECECDMGYQGDNCDECHENYYDAGKGVCEECHKSCDSSCKDGTSKGCDECASGYVEKEDEGCKDKDECEDEEICREGTFCLNTIGSFKCKDCHMACKEGCNGTGALSCTECNEGWSPIEGSHGCLDIDECIKDHGCTMGTFCVNTEGSFKCEPCHPACDQGCSEEGALACKACKEGYQWSDDKGCVDVDECSDGSMKCKSGEYCVNVEGSARCEACDDSCIECVGKGSMGCLQCTTGYLFTKNGCEDINECGVSNPCNKATENCVNIPGSHRCKCKKGHVRSKQGTCIKKTIGKKQKEELAKAKLMSEDSKEEL